MSDNIFEDVSNLMSAGLRAKGDWGEIETDTPIEGIIIAVGIAAGLGAIAYGLMKTAFKKVTK